MSPVTSFSADFHTLHRPDFNYNNKSEILQPENVSHFFSSFFFCLKGTVYPKKWQFGHHLLTLMLTESFCSPQNISGASRWNSVAACSSTTESRWTLVFTKNTTDIKRKIVKRLVQFIQRGLWKRRDPELIRENFIYNPVKGKSSLLMMRSRRLRTRKDPNLLLDQTPTSWGSNCLTSAPVGRGSDELDDRIWTGREIFHNPISRINVS